MTEFLRLPRFVFLCGTPDSGQEPLSIALTTAVPGSTVLSFFAPLYEGVTSIFTPGFDPDPIALLKMNENEKICPPSEWTTQGMIDRLDDLFEDELGVDYLARIADSILREGGCYDVYDTFIFSDCEQIANAAYFVHKFGGDSCLAIHCGALRTPLSAAKNIWLSIPTLESRMLQLRRELCPAPPATKFILPSEGKESNPSSG